MIALAFLIVALVLFILAATNLVQDGRILPAGLAFLTAAFIASNSSLF